MLPDDDLQRPVGEFSSRDFPTLDVSLTIGEAIASVRAHGLRDKIIYFYVVDSEGRLEGVLPTRRLLTDPEETLVSEAMIQHVVAIPDHVTLELACEFFVLHKFLAFPIVDSERRIVGLLDVSVFTGEVLDLAERKQMDDLFQALGVRVAELQVASAWGGFRLRFPWLLTTIVGGTLCAVVVGTFAQTLETKIVLAFFLTLVLGLGESVSAQSVAVTLQAMHGANPTFAWLLRATKKEFATATLLGLSCGTLVGTIVGLWSGDARAAATVGTSILLAMVTACLLGVIIPAASRALHLDPKIAAGPLTLALADLCTLLFYFGLATWWLT